MRLAQAHYAHIWRLIVEFLRFPLLSAAQRADLVRVENLDVLLEAHSRGKGVLILTGHFGNFEVATAAGIAKFPQARGHFHFIRRPFKPRWLEDFVYSRSRRLGFGSLPKRGSLDLFIDRLAAGDIILFPFDQYAAGRDGIEVEFFGHPAGTFRSLAIIARATGAPVVPASAWREADGRHVLRFEEPLPPDRVRGLRRGDPPQHARLQRGARTTDPAPPRAVVVDASEMEGGGAMRKGSPAPARATGRRSRALSGERQVPARCWPLRAGSGHASCKGFRRCSARS